MLDFEELLNTSKSFQGKLLAYPQHKTELSSMNKTLSLLISK